MSVAVNASCHKHIPTFSGIAAVAALLITMACGQTGPTPVTPSALSNTTESPYVALPAGEPAVLQATVGKQDCSVAFSPGTKVISSTKGANFTLKISFPSASNPSACGRWKFSSEAGLRVMHLPGNSKATDITAFGDQVVEFEVPDSDRRSNEQTKKRATTVFLFDQGTTHREWKLQADRWCPESKWCKG
jgi:hypothetical protein